MAKTVQEERLRWILPLARGEIKLRDLMRICPHGKRSIERWLSAYRKRGVKGLIPLSTSPKTSPHETPIRIKERVVEKRIQTKLCAQKLHWILAGEGLKIPARTIGKVLKDEGLVRRYRVRRIKYKYIKAERLPGELLEIDVKYVPGKLGGKRYFQYTAIDTSSRWRHLEIYEEQSTYYSIMFLEEVMRRFPYPVQSIKTDNHSIFTNYYVGSNKRSDLTVKTIHELDGFCAKHNITHYLIDPGKPAQNGKVERSHRTDQEQFYERNIFQSPKDLKKKVRLWNIYYNGLVHCGLNGKSPEQFLAEYKP